VRDSSVATRLLVVAMAVLVGSVTVPAQQTASGGRAELHGQVAALKAALAKNKAALALYSWTEVTEVVVEGDPGNVIRTECRVGPDGTLEKTSAGEAVETPGGGHDQLQPLLDLVHQYLPPDGARALAAFRSGGVSLVALPGGRTALVLDDYVKPGDRLSIELDPVAAKIRSAVVSTYHRTPEEFVIFTAGYEDLPDGTNHVRQTDLASMRPNVRVTVTNAQYIRSSSATGTEITEGAEITGSHSGTEERRRH
jgi:hypothetical protein